MSESVPALGIIYTDIPYSSMRGSVAGCLDRVELNGPLLCLHWKVAVPAGFVSVRHTGFRWLSGRRPNISQLYRALSGHQPPTNQRCPDWDFARALSEFVGSRYLLTVEPRPGVLPCLFVRDIRVFGIEEGPKSA